MECLEFDSSDFFLDGDAIDCPLEIHLESNSSAGAKAAPDHSRNAQLHRSNAPDPPPLPGTSYDARRSSRKAKACRRVPEGVVDSWDKLFLQGYQSDLRVSTDDGTEILSHSCVLGVQSPVLRAMLEEAKLKDGFRCVRISGAPSEAVRVFIRFLYSSRFEQEQMKKHVLHLLVLSHVFSVPSLKIVCIDQLERSFLAPDNVVDMLQLARLCDAPRLSLVCTRMIIGDFKTISLTDGWKVMRRVNPSMEQELLESLVEADTTVSNRWRTVPLHVKIALQPNTHTSNPFCVRRRQERKKASSRRDDAKGEGALATPSTPCVQAACRPSSSPARRAARAAARISPSPCPSARSPPPSPSRSLSHQSPPPPGGPPRRASPLQAPRSSSSRPRSRSWSACAASAAAPAGRCGWCVTAGRGGPTYALKVLYGKRGRGRSPRAASRGRARRRAAGRGRGRGWSRMAALGGAAPAMLGPSGVRLRQDEATGAFLVCVGCWIFWVRAPSLCGSQSMRRQERAKRMEERKVYLQLYEAMEALVHICRDGCRTIGPRDQALKGSLAAACKFPACKGIELLVRHFSTCRVRVPGGCANCKRMWQLLELHSRMCFTPDTCKVPLCRHFKEKMRNLGRKEETKWNLLVCKVLGSRGTMGFMPERRKISSSLMPAGSCHVAPLIGPI